jgi:DNA-binding response OmpR family regulator
MTAMTSAPVARKRILCVDDHEDTRDMMRVLIGHYGYEAVIAASVPEALESARSGGLALCILDHWLEEGDGMELCQQIRTFDSQTPIIFYSGAGYKADIQKGLDAGADGYVVKPDFEHLEATIDRLIREAGSKHSVVMFPPPNNGPADSIPWDSGNSSLNSSVNESGCPGLLRRSA